MRHTLLEKIWYTFNISYRAEHKHFQVFWVTDAVLAVPILGGQPRQAWAGHTPWGNAKYYF